MQVGQLFRCFLVLYLEYAANLTQLRLYILSSISALCQQKGTTPDNRREDCRTVRFVSLFIFCNDEDSLKDMKFLLLLFWQGMVWGRWKIVSVLNSKNRRVAYNNNTNDDDDNILIIVLLIIIIVKVDYIIIIIKIIPESFEETFLKAL